MNKPKYIYKYEPFSPRSIQNLKAQSLYFGSPLNFNDPYDCALYPGFEEPTVEEIEIFRNHYAQKKDIPLKAREEFLSQSTEELRGKLLRTVKSALEQQSKSFLETRGVTCFSESKDDLLMWSHYGGCYKGFCLEFSTNYEPFSKLRKVDYSPEIPKANCLSMLLGENYDHITMLYCTKSMSWDYEKEWRCIHNEAGTLYTYESDALESIYFGPDIEAESLEIICLIILGQNPNVKIWKGSRSQERFEVNFTPFNYISYIDAKRNGLIT